MFFNINSTLKKHKVFNKKYLPALVSITLFIFLIVSRLLNFNTRNILTYTHLENLFFIVFINTFWFYTFHKDKGFIKNLILTICLILDLLGVFIIQILVLISLSFQNSSIIVSILIFICSSAFILTFAFKNLGNNKSDKLLSLVLGIFVYLSLIIDTSLIFFVYYLSNGYIDVTLGHQFSKLSGSKEIFKFLANTSLDKCFNYPTSSKYISMYVQYFIGKLSDVFLLGCVLWKLTTSESKNELINKIRKLKNSLSVENNNNLSLTKNIETLMCQVKSYEAEIKSIEQNNLDLNLKLDIAIEENNLLKIELKKLKNISNNKKAIKK